MMPLLYSMLMKILMKMGILISFLHFRTQDVGIGEDDTEVILTGMHYLRDFFHRTHTSYQNRTRPRSRETGPGKVNRHPGQNKEPGDNGRWAMV